MTSFGALALATLALAQAPALVDGVAAAVGRKVLTLTEVRAEARMLLVLRVGVAGLEKPLDRPFLRSVLDYAVVQELLVQRARRDGIIIAEAEVDRGEARFQAQFSSEEQYRDFLADLGVDRDLVRAVVRRDAAVGELLRRLRQSDPIVISDEAIDAYLRVHVDLKPGAPSKERRQAAEDAIFAVAEKERLHAFVTTLRAETEVRVVAAFSQP